MIQGRAGDSKNSIFGLADSTNVRAREDKPWFFAEKWAPLKVGSRTVYVNINSMAKRLNISKERINELKNQDSTGTQLAKELNKVLQPFTSLLSKVESAKQYLASMNQSGGAVPGLRSGELSLEQYTKITAAAQEIFLNYPHPKEGQTFHCMIHVQGQNDLPVHIFAHAGSLYFDIGKLLIDEGASRSEGGFKRAQRAFALEALDQTVVNAVAKKSPKNLTDVQKQEQLAMFRAEGELNYQLCRGHQNIVQVHSYNGQAIRMENYQGPRVQDELAKPTDNQTLNNKINICKQIAIGMTAIHQQGVAHRDLKPENCFMKTAENGQTVGVVAVGDFGLSIQNGQNGAPAKSPNKNAGLSSTCGTPPYVPPERVLEDPSIVHAQDIERLKPGDVFAVGVMLYEAITQQIVPWDSNSRGEIRERMLDFFENSQSNLKKFFDDNLAKLETSGNAKKMALANLIKLTLDRTPGNRPTMAQVSQELERIETLQLLLFDVSNLKMPEADRPIFQQLYQFENESDTKLVSKISQKQSEAIKNNQFILRGTSKFTSVNESPAVVVTHKKNILLSQGIILNQTMLESKNKELNNLLFKEKNFEKLKEATEKLNGEIAALRTKITGLEKQLQTKGDLENYPTLKHELFKFENNKWTSQEKNKQNALVFKDLTAMKQHYQTLNLIEKQ